jgi:hypothetical protein
MNRPLVIASLGEAGTGVILLSYPPIVVRLLFGAKIGGAGIIMSRIAGIALIGLGVACWPGNPRQPTYGMLTYSLVAMLYLKKLISPARRTFDAEAVGYPGTSFRESMQGLLRLAKWTLPSGLIISHIAATLLRNLR